MEVAGCPWKIEHRLVRVGLKGRVIESEQRPAMQPRVPAGCLGVDEFARQASRCLKEGMKLLVRAVARERSRGDRRLRQFRGTRAAVHARGRSADRSSRPWTGLEAGGSTTGGAGIELAYRIARRTSSRAESTACSSAPTVISTWARPVPAALERMVEERARSGVFLSVLGFGRGNLNDAMMETISNKGNGNYAYIDGITEARKVLVQQAGGTLITIAKDVKIQVEFNPAQVAAYRLIGYENRILAAEDFNDDKKDAGEIGAGHAVTAFYELVPAW